MHFPHTFIFIGYEYVQLMEREREREEHFCRDGSILCCSLINIMSLVDKFHVSRQNAVSLIYDV